MLLRRQNTGLRRCQERKNQSEPVCSISEAGLVYISCSSPEDAGEGVSSQVMDKHQVSQAGQGALRVAHLLLQEAWNLFPPQQREEDQSREGLSDCTQNLLQREQSPR